MTKMRMVWRLWPLLGIVAVGASLAAALLQPESARAHAVLECSLPVQNEQLQEPPEASHFLQDDQDEEIARGMAEFIAANPR